MADKISAKFFDFTGKTAIITGGAGVLAYEMVKHLVEQGCNVAILDLNAARGEQILTELAAAPGKVRFFKTNILEKESVEEVAGEIKKSFTTIDFLINAAGGNHPKATVNAENSFFDLPAEAIRFVFDLNCFGTIITSQIFGRFMAEQGFGNIINISSMNAFRPLTRIAAYSAAKAAVSNFTQWLAVHMARDYSPRIRVNAIAPGFFITDQNRYLLIDAQTGELTDRGKTIIAHTPIGRFGDPVDLIGALFWLLSDASAFVTGIVVPVDGGFSAFSGV